MFNVTDTQVWFILYFVREESFILELTFTPEEFIESYCVRRNSLQRHFPSSSLR